MPHGHAESKHLLWQTQPRTEFGSHPYKSTIYKPKAHLANTIAFFSCCSIHGHKEVLHYNTLQELSRLAIAHRLKYNKSEPQEKFKIDGCDYLQLFIPQNNFT